MLRNAFEDISTAAKQDSQITLLTAIRDFLDTVETQQASQATAANQGTQTTRLTEIRDHLDTVEALLASVISNTDGLEGFVDELEARVGEVAASPTANTVQDRLKGIRGVLDSVLTELQGKADLTDTQPVSVQNFPGTQPVSGTVSVSNLPAVQPVSDNGGSLTIDGTVGVDNFPATYDISDRAARLLGVVDPQGNVASGATDAGNPVKVGGRYNATLPTFTDGQRGDLQLDARGGIFTVLKSAGGLSTATVAATTDDQADAAGLVTVSRLQAYDGAAWDRVRINSSGRLDVDLGNVGVYGLNADGLGTAVNGLRTFAANAVYNGASWDRLRALPSSSATASSTGVLHVGLGLWTSPGNVAPQISVSAMGDASGASANIAAVHNALYNGSTYDRQRGVAASGWNQITSLAGYGLTALGVMSNNTSMYPVTNAAALGDANALNATLSVGNYVYNGSSWDRLRGDLTYGIRVREHQPSASTVTRVTLTAATNGTLAASNANRRTLKIFNESAGTLYLKEGATASATSYTVQVPQGSFYEVQVPAYTGVVDGYSVGGGVIMVTES